MGRPRKGTEGDRLNPPRRRARNIDPTVQQSNSGIVAPLQNLVSYHNSAGSQQFSHLLGAVEMAAQEHQHLTPIAPMHHHQPRQIFNHTSTSDHEYNTADHTHASAIDPALESFDMTRPTPPIGHFFDVRQCLVNQTSNFDSHNVTERSLASGTYNAAMEHQIIPASSTNYTHTDGDQDQTQSLHIKSSSTLTQPLLP